jgi:prenyltransferase beta subunit
MRAKLLSLGLLLLHVSFLSAQAPTAEQRAATVKYVLSLRKDSGGFAADNKPDAAATVPATSSALRAIKYFGGNLPEPKRTAAFLTSCLDKDTGTYRPTAAGKPDVRTTALGIMAWKELGELRPPAGSFEHAFTGYLTNEAKSFEDVRIAAAAYETWLPEATDWLKPATLEAWQLEVNKQRNADGTYGKDGSLARDTGGSAVTILRVGGKLNSEQREAVLKAIRAGQRADGGWGKDGAKSSDLETTYRVLRCLHMLKSKPNVAACQGFIAKCRNDDGSYSVEPGQPGNVSGTYFAGIMLHWLE